MTSGKEREGEIKVQVCIGHPESAIESCEKVGGEAEVQDITLPLM